MRDYGRVFCALWRSRDFRSLTEDGRALVLYLLTCAHGTMIGAFNLPALYACDDMQWEHSRLLKTFDELSRKGFATLCSDTHWVWIRKYLDWNEPDNPNVWKAARKLASKIPESCSWDADFQEYFEHCFDLAEAEKQAGKGAQKRNRSRTVSKQGTGTGEGSGKGEGTGTVEGTGTGGALDPNPVDNSTGGGEERRAGEDFGGENSPPEEPSRRRGAAAERRNGDFEGINDAVSKLLAAGVCKPHEYREIGRHAHISALQAEIAVRQLRDRGRLPQASAA